LTKVSLAWIIKGYNWSKMNFRAPWIEGRVALLARGLFDAAITIAVYNIVSWQRLGAADNLSRGVIAMTCIWLGLSYILGRYRKSEMNWTGLTEIIAKCVAVCIIVGSVFVMYSWIVGIDGNATKLRGFLIPILSLTGCFSVISDIIFIYGQRSLGKNWVIVIGESQYEIIRKILKESGKDYVNIRVVRSFTKHDLWLSCDSSIAISSAIQLSDEVCEALFRKRIKGEEVIDIVTWCERYLGKIPPELVTSIWLSSAEGFTLRKGSYYWRIKRLSDIIVGGFLLVVTAPVVVLAGMIIFMQDGASPIYMQERTGLYGERIRVWKLRTMIVNSEKEGPVWAGIGDKRITRVGKILRATRVDELPQLFSVIGGSMSLIGPRPERPIIEEELEKEIPHYRIRHWIKPGLSGWAQVCFRYGASIEDSKEKLAFDLFYLRNAGILLDALVLIKTIRLIFGAKGYKPI
jgi:lipopolysaccharide/colanic/teichoic acid biosynthesis glycosyltransferase/heme/copper-type cytochrome/quinol oxidase subunit 4